MGERAIDTECSLRRGVTMTVFAGDRGRVAGCRLDARPLVELSLARSLALFVARFVARFVAFARTLART
ncbi:MAG: hypothetical protein KC468_00510, partial [Myxococcales bacterium]|nr:hypothetical protein [Myxococcales bacterium]